MMLGLTVICLAGCSSVQMYDCPKQSDSVWSR